MSPINEKTYFGIAGDAFISGAFELEGNSFIGTIQYLKDYLQSLSRNSDNIPRAYQQLLSNTDYLVDIVQSMININRTQDIKYQLELINDLVVNIADRLARLGEGEILMLPGGWGGMPFGHFMIYQFTRSLDTYQFTVINAGAGLKQYHARKSISDKELYNPTKIWHFATPNEETKPELIHFIQRLLEPKLCIYPKKKPINAEVMYQEIFPSISYIGGVECDANIGLREHAYTGGQLSGTCTQRSLHQMLKINSETDAEYQHFIFEFKLYALNDYLDAINAKKCICTGDIVAQIQLSIENNLKILKTPGLFTDEEIDLYLKRIEYFSQRLEDVKSTLEVNAGLYNVSSDDNPIAQFSLTYKTIYKFPKPRNDFSNEFITNKCNVVTSNNLLFRLRVAINKITDLYDIEKIILTLPLNPDGTFVEFYKELRTKEHFIKFKEHIDRLNRILLQYEETPTSNIMLLSLASLMVDAQEQIIKFNELPSFKKFTDSVIGTVVNSQKRNPWYASDHPGFDQKILLLRARYESALFAINHQEYYSYLNDLLDKESASKEQLRSDYVTLINTDQAWRIVDSETRIFIDDNKLQSLYMLSRMFYNTPSIIEKRKYSSIFNLIKNHIMYEDSLIFVIKRFLSRANDKNFFIVCKAYGVMCLLSSLTPTWIQYHTQSKTLLNHKYDIQNSLALDALKNDIPDKAPSYGDIKIRSANDIQLHRDSSIVPVTQRDIVARDYFVMRSVPQLQIGLTLDYFTRHVDLLFDESNQRYVEANLFQPGLLLEDLQGSQFIPQFDRFLEIGLRQFTDNRVYTRESIIFLRLNYLVSRYMALTDKKDEGLTRLHKHRNEIVRQVALSQNSDVQYALKQYLFLNLITVFELGEMVTPELFTEALAAYFYLKAHANPNILEDNAHRAHVDGAMHAFKYIMQQQSDDCIKLAIQQALFRDASSVTINGTFPSYSIFQEENLLYNIDVIQGLLFKKDLARASVPLKIKNHPLIKQLGMNFVDECFINQNDDYMELCCEDAEIHLRYNPTELYVEKNWCINSQQKYYLLVPLTFEHLALKANIRLAVVNVKLPKVLMDGSINYWAAPDDAQKKSWKAPDGLLTQNNVPVYAVSNNRFELLNSQRLSTGYILSHRPLEEFKQFESHQFILTHRGSSGVLVKLPRYGLTFEKDSTSPNLVYTKTGERVMERPAQLHVSIAGLVLETNDHSRLLVPVSRFYATTTGAVRGALYPVVHDIRGVIKQACLDEHWKITNPQDKPLWHYQDSERCVSFQLENGELVANTVADALYLAYIYLATDQTDKAWRTLDYCKTWFGGLTGDPAELQFIAWICMDMPHILPNAKTETDDAKRQTEPYVGCQLKAISILCEFLLDAKSFALTAPRDNQTANSVYAKLEHEALDYFLNQLPKSVYQLNSRYQTMKRHRGYAYQLDTTERMTLLTYYEDSRPEDQPPLGSMGYEWLSLTLESIEREREALYARTTSSVITLAERKRFRYIRQRLAALKPVMAHSTQINSVAIDLSLPKGIKLNRTDLGRDALNILDEWEKKLPQVTAYSPIDEAMTKLSSRLSEQDCIKNFPVYFNVALGSDQEKRKKLSDFCANTLIANRHVPLDKQDSNIPLLCNILYRVLSISNSKCRVLPQSLSFEKWILVLICYPIDLSVYEATNLYTTILANPETILSQHRRLQDTPIQATVLDKKTIIEQTTLLNCLTSEQVTQLNNFIAEYQRIQSSSAEAITHLESELNTQEIELGVEENYQGAREIEKAAGRVLFARDKQQLGLIDHFHQQGMFKVVHDATKVACSRLAEQSKHAWDQALALANSGPSDPKLAKTWQIERMSKCRAILNEASLLSLYCQASVTQSIQETGLDRESSQMLHDLIHQALVADIVKQVVERTATDLKKAVDTNDINYAVETLAWLARDELPGLDNPAIVVIQHQRKSLLRSEQIRAFKILLTKEVDGRPCYNTIQKITMGGGKSKYILPVWAEVMADGYNLPVIEVPPSLLKTNYVDLNRESQRLFGKKIKKIYCLEYNRDNNNSPKILKRLYQNLIDVITTRGYVVTTGDAVQSLELKSIEMLRELALLNKEGKRDPVLEQQAEWLDKIMNLFHHYAVGMIDEAHQGLSIQKVLNYTSGESRPLSDALRKNAVEFFKLINREFIVTAPTLPMDYDWSAYKLSLAESLIKHTNSPLSAFMSKVKAIHGQRIEAELIKYLIGQVDYLPEVVGRASPDEQELLAFLKAEITVILPQTLSRVVDVNYGASKLNDLMPDEQTLAIPYAASNTPNERSRFGNELEAINYTTQMMIINGISKALIIQKIIEWQTAARRELLEFKDGEPILSNMPTARGFFLLTGGLDLSQMNVNDETQMTEVHAKLKYNETLMFDLLRDQSLKQIKQDGAILSSDSFNHFSLYRKGAGITGTPDPMTAPDGLVFDKAQALGEDGLIVRMLEHKQTRIISLDYQSLETFLDAALKRSSAPERIRAIIDINATFKGTMNVQVARELASYIRNSTQCSQPIKHVLYFNEERVLYAIDIAKPNEPILLGTTDENVVKRLLDGSTPNERFTYYDQEHTLGVDIAQASHSHALVMMDDKKKLNDFFQGCKRMRGLNLGQTIDIIVPERNHALTLSTLIAAASNNEKQDLLKASLFAAKGRMKNRLRRDLLSRIQALPSEQVLEKAALVCKYDSFLVTISSLNLFTLYGSINKPQATYTILKQYMDQLIYQWKECIGPNAEEGQVAKDLNRIIMEALPNCLEVYENVSESLDMSVETQKEVQKQVQIELVALEDSYLSDVAVELEKSWGNIRADLPYMDPTMVLDLNTVCAGKKAAVTIFDVNLMASVNYTKVYKTQAPTAYVGAFLKPVFLIWYHLDEGQQLHALIVTPQEEASLCDRYGYPNNTWLSTTDGTVLKGIRPDDILTDIRYQSLQEQVRFFNGECDSLLKPTLWTHLCINSNRQTFHRIA